MTCKKIRRLIESYVDGTASAHEREAVTKHIDTCAPCARALEYSRQLVGILGDLPVRRVDEGFEARLFAALGDQEPAPSRGAWWERFRLQFEWRLRTPAMMTASGLALAALVCGIVAPPIMQTEAGKREVMAATVEQHKQLQASTDIDEVDASIELIAGPDVAPITP